MEISKKMTNVEIAKLLKAVAAAYKLKDPDKNKFKVIAYERASDAIEHLSSEAKDLWDEGKLTDVAGIGKSIAEHLDEIFRTGKSKHFEKIMKDLPPAMFELMGVPGIGPKTAFKLSKELGIKESKTAIKKLEKAVVEGKVSGITGFGSQSQTAMQKSIQEAKGRTKRQLLPYAENLADEVIAWLKKDKNVVQVDALGSLRRRAATVGDIDIAAATKDLAKTLEHFTQYPQKSRILERGERTASIIVPGNKQVDLMVTDPASYGSLLQHFTGSKHHNIALREYALKRKISLSEYGIKKAGKLIKTATEEDFYQKLGIDWIPPELREDTGEIEAGQNHKLPRLVELKDVRADLQIHSDFDIETSHDVGESSMEEIVKQASELGYEYLAFTEHNPSQSGHNEKQIINLLQKKKERIDKLNYSLKKDKKIRVKKVYNSLEIDILPSGELPVPEKALEVLDFALIAIHASFRQSKEAMTNRVLKALAHPKAKIFAHPTGRKLGHRESVEMNWPKIFEFCKKHDKWLEINADPMRLDLPDFLVHEAVNAGVKLTLGTDSHAVNSLINMRYGVDVARRGWATKKDIVNSRSWVEFEKMLK